MKNQWWLSPCQRWWRCLPLHLRWWRCLLHPKEGSRWLSGILPGVSTYIYYGSESNCDWHCAKITCFLFCPSTFEKKWQEKKFRVSIFLKLFVYHGVSILFVMVLVFMCCGIDVSKGNGKAKWHCGLSHD